MAAPFIIGKPLDMAVAAGAKVVTFDRDNSVKHAVSIIKARCKLPGFANHFTGNAKKVKPAMLLTSPRGLYAMSALTYQRRVRLAQRAEKYQDALAYQLSYEDLQQFKVSTINQLLADVGTSPEYRYVPSPTSTKKLTTEHLDEILLGYDTLDDAFADGAPCLRRMLHSKKAHGIPLCDEVDAPTKSAETARSDIEQAIASMDEFFR